MLLMAENGIRGGIRNIAHRYSKSNNKYIRKYDSSTKSSYFMYWNVNRLYVLMMLQKLLVYGFKKKKKMSRLTNNNRFMQNCDDNSNKGHILDADAGHPKHLQKNTQ